MASPLTNKYSVGNKFGKLLIIQKLPPLNRNNKKRGRSLVECDCGNMIVVINSTLVKNTKSCGCIQKEYIKNQKNRKTHGKSTTRIYRIYHKMLERCYNHRNSSYGNYGARGITVCYEWRNNFMSFYNWATNNGYSSKLSIDRENNNGNYNPENCRWADDFTQKNNKRNTILVGENNNPLMVELRNLGLEGNYKNIWQRMNRGKSFKEAIEIYL